MFDRFFKKTPKEQTKDVYSFRKEGMTRDMLLDAIKEAEKEDEPLRTVQLSGLYGKVVSFNRRTRTLSVAPIDPGCSIAVSEAIKKIWDLIAELKLTEQKEVNAFLSNAFRKDGPYKNLSDEEKARAIKTILENKGMYEESNFEY